MPEPCAPAAERNKHPLLVRLRQVLPARGSVLEIGSGTGQHAAHFARHLPGLIWQPSDLAEHHAGIHAWREASGAPNLHTPLTLDVRDSPWPVSRADAVVSINTAHIMAWRGVAAMFAGSAALLPRGAIFALYGPFRFAGVHTAPSNARFDAELRGRDADMGIRDVVDLQALAREHDLVLTTDFSMPANNRLLIWTKLARPRLERRDQR